MAVETKSLQDIDALRALAEQTLNTSDLDRQLALDYFDAAGHDGMPTDAEMATLRQKVRRRLFPKIAQAMADLAAGRRGSR